MPDQPPPNSRRNRLRLSVRGLIILVLVIGSWLGWLARTPRSSGGRSRHSTKRRIDSIMTDNGGETFSMTLSLTLGDRDG